MKKRIEIEGWIVKSDLDGNYLFNSHMNPKGYYLVTLIKDFAIECHFLKQEIDAIPESEKDEVIKEKLKMTIFEYGSGRNFPWCPA